MSVAQEFADRGWIRKIDPDHGIFEVVCFQCCRVQIVIEVTDDQRERGVDGGPDLRSVIEDIGWSFPVIDVKGDPKKICLCPFCGTPKDEA